MKAPKDPKIRLTRAASNEIPMFVSPGYIDTFVDLLHKNGMRREALKRLPSAYLEVLYISHPDSMCFKDGLRSNFSDIEDSFQYFSALSSGCDFLLNTNLTDYRCGYNSNITVTSPLDFLTTVLKKQKGIDF